MTKNLLLYRSAWSESGRDAREWFLYGAARWLLSLVEINASRPYKELKRSGRLDPHLHQVRYEAILKCVSLGVMLLAAGMVTWRLAG